MARTLRISHSFVKFSSKNISERKRKGKRLPLFDVMKRLVVEINTDDIQGDSDENMDTLVALQSQSKTNLFEFKNPIENCTPQKIFYFNSQQSIAM